MHVLELIVSLYYSTARWMATRLGRDEELIAPHMCSGVLARFAHGRIQGRAKNGHRGPPSSKQFFRWMFTKLSRDEELIASQMC